MEEQERKENTDQAEPELLYHYTDQKGLLGIVENKCLWATHSQFLNDLSEYQIVFDALRELIQKKIKTDRNEKWANLFDLLIGIRKIQGVFVSSFSGGKEADSLTMWRGYSGATGGYSIGFDRLALELIRSALFAPGENGWEDMGKCFYVDPEDPRLAESLENWIKAVLPDFVDPPTNFSESDWKDPMSIVRLTPIEIMRHVEMEASLAALVKHIGFKEENEWRIVIVDEDGLTSKRTRFRQGRSTMIPYVEVSWRDNGLPNPIRRILVGPSPNKDEAKRAVEMLLERYRIPVKTEDCPGGVEVVSSKIPYRNW
jgi:hypothetical protein